jgi:hypothetical protein
MVDPMTPDPMTQGMTGQESDRPAPTAPGPPIWNGGEFGPTADGYETGDAGVYPVMSPQMAPDRSDEGAPIYARPRVPLPSPGRSSDMTAGYQNEDYAIVDRWVQEVQARGNEVRKTAVGTFEVDPDGRIVSPMPSPYRMN